MAPEDDQVDVPIGADADMSGGDEDAGMEQEVGGGWRATGAVESPAGDLRPGKSRAGVSRQRAVSRTSRGGGRKAGARKATGTSTRKTSRTRPRKTAKTGSRKTTRSGSAKASGGARKKTKASGGGTKKTKASGGARKKKMRGGARKSSTQGSSRKRR